MPASASKASKKPVVLTLDDSSDSEDSTFGSKAKAAHAKSSGKGKTSETSTQESLSARDDEKANGDSQVKDTLDVVLPPLIGTGNSGECSLLIQVEPDDAARLDYEGVTGAIGRFEAGDHGIVLDLKGRQYQGSLLPGPTAMLVGLTKGGILRVEGITDEFSTLVETQDVMAQMDAIVTGAKLDEGYKVVEENVNRPSKAATAAAQAAKAKEEAKNSASKGTTPKSQGTTKTAGGKRSSSKTPSKPHAKRKKSATPKN